MKKALLGTTALIAGGLIAGSVMAADLEPAPLPAPVDEGFEVTVSGTAFAGFFYRNNNRNATVADEGQTAVPWLSEIWFTATTTLANGIQVGVRVELEGVSEDNNAVGAARDGDQIDEHYIWLQGNFGRFEIGANDSVADAMSISGPSSGALGYSGPSFTALAAAGVTDSRRRYFTGDANKVNYFTPRISGFQAGVSFTPTTTNGGGAEISLRTTSQYENVFSVAANYRNTFNDVTVAFGAGYETGKGSGTAATTSGRRSVWNVGASVGFGGFTIGGAYGVDNNGTTSTVGGAGGVRLANDKVWTVSAAYGTGPWTVSAGFLQGKRGSVKYRRIGGGAAYALGTGVTLTADVNFEKETGNAVAANNGKGVIAGVGIATAF
jgi:predicted porin